MTAGKSDLLWGPQSHSHRCPKFFELHIMPREVGAHSEVTNKAPSNAIDQQ